MKRGFDCFKDYHRKQYLWASEGEQNLIEKVMRYAIARQAERNSPQISLFGADDNNVAAPLPRAAEIKPFTQMEELKIEKEIVGFYISGHPLDQFQIELESFCKPINDMNKFPNQEISIAGIVNSVKNGHTKNGKPYGVVNMEDYNGSVELFLMGEQFIKHAHYFKPEAFLFISGKMEINWNKQKEIRKNPAVTPAPEDWRLNVLTVSLLSELREKRGKGLHIKLDAQTTDQKRIEKLVSLAKAHQGKSLLKVELLDRNENIQANLLARDIRVNPNNELIQSLKACTETVELMVN